MCSFRIDDVTLNLVYRPPSAAAESIVELADAISGAGANEVFLGDFNMPGIDWVGGSSRGREALFAEAVENALMQQMIDFPTQVKGNTLDLVITNIPERIEEVYDAGRFGKSDHVMVVTKISVGGGDEEETPPGKDWRRADWTAMRQELARGDWLTSIRRAAAADAWAIFREMSTSMRKRSDCINHSSGE